MRLSIVMAAFLMTALAACNTTATAHPPKPETHLAATITRKATEHGVPPKLAKSIVKVESNFNCKAKNPNSSASGAMQVLRRTAKGVGVHGNLFNCETGVEAGMRYLKQAYEAADGDWCKTATLYNRGVYARPVKSAYCRKVLAAAATL